MNKNIIRLIDKLYKELYLSKSVIHHGTKNKYDKFNNIRLYLEKLENIHNNALKKEHYVKILKNFYYNKYIIKRENIKEEYYLNKLNLSTRIEKIINKKRIIKIQEDIIENQKRSLDIWIDYLINNNSIPFELKYWAFQGMLDLGTYNIKEEKFNKRTKYTIEPFIELNEEALAISIDLILKSLNKISIEEKELDILVKSGSFKKIYTYILNKIIKEQKNINKNNIGMWIKYTKGEHIKLINSLQGYNTKWCSVGEITAKSQLNLGDIYIYYTLDKNGEYKIPRIAIRKKGNEIVEIKGVAKNQNLEPELEKVVEIKLMEFNDKDKYYKKVNDMKFLTYIYNKHKKREKLSKEELLFLYEILDKIDYFGLEKDSRVKEILKSRNQRLDLAKCLNCNVNEIVFKKSKINKNTIYYGNSLNVKDIDILPRIINGSLTFRKEIDIENIILPEVVCGSLNLENILNVKKLIFPKIILGPVYLNNLVSADNLYFDDKVNGNIYLDNLKKCDILLLPSHVGKNIYLNELSNAKLIQIPKKINGYIFLDNINNSNCLKFYESFEGNVILNGIKDSNGLQFPNKFKGSLSLNGITSAKNLKLPNDFIGSLSMSGLSDIDELKLPMKFNGNIYLTNIENINEVQLPLSGDYKIYLKEKTITSENKKNKKLILKI